jgi:hypothetical protein
LKLEKISDTVCLLHTADGTHVGNLKWIQAAWKFKAIGYEANGEVIPGGGMLTDRHNTLFADLDLAVIRATLMPGHATPP